METNSISKEKFINELKHFNSIKQNSLEKHVESANIFQVPENELSEEFVLNYKKHLGKFVFCKDAQELADNLKFLIAEKKWDELYCYNGVISQLLGQIGITFRNFIGGRTRLQVSITQCDYLVARTGSIVITSKKEREEQIYNLCDHLVVIATLRQILPDMKTVFDKLRQDGASMPAVVNVLNGVSSTLSFESDVLEGAQGLKSCHLFLLP